MRLSLLCLFALAAAAPAADRPNVLWITCEDISPHVHCFGDAFAITPNLDRLAAEGVRYTNAFAPIGVCAPSRSTLVMGMWAPSVGTQHMRCQGTLPAGLKCYPDLLRAAGYYCTNNSKTDYNFAGKNAERSRWDDCSTNAHWRNRPKGKPFVAVFNILTTHEGQIRMPAGARNAATLAPAERHDPAKVPIPPYHPDAPEVRQDWARLYDLVTVMDKEVGKYLKQLADDGLADDTIVFFYADHGTGMPRSKRWLFDSSTRVPLILRFPEKWKKLAPSGPGTTSEQLVNFVDFGPTLLSLCAVPVPANMQGVPFLGPQQLSPREYVYGFRDRMDERYDLIRSVHDKRFNYIRNFRPDLPYFNEQHISYLYEMPTMKAWQKLADAGKLTGPQAIFMAKTKPIEELYDVQADPHEIHNLADSPEHQATLLRMRAECRRWQKSIMDLGFLPEADLRTRFGNESPYDAVRRKPSLYPIDRIAAAADLLNPAHPPELRELTRLFTDSDPATRYWGALGIGSLGERGADGVSWLKALLDDPATFVRVAAADSLCRLGHTADALPALRRGADDKNEFVRLQAANVLDRINDRSPETLAVMKKLANDSNSYVQRVAEYVLSKSSKKE
jgi:N-sulfoglucosamine sulfohydrolase